MFIQSGISSRDSPARYKPEKPEELLVHRFGKKSLLLAIVVISLLLMLAFATRSSMQSAGAETGAAIRARNARIQQAMELVESQ